MSNDLPALVRFHGLTEDPLSAWRTMPRVFAVPDYIRHEWRTTTTASDKLLYSIANHFHPFAQQLSAELLRGSVAGLQAADTRIADGRATAFKEDYGTGKTVESTPVRSLAFDRQDAYSVYNWELFFHIPMAIALHLSRNQRHEEAQRWLHYIFDPTDDGPGEMERFWQVKPLRKDDVKEVDEILRVLSDSNDQSEAAQNLRSDTIHAIEAWRQNPFRPHVVARARQGAYKVRALTAYLDNLISWGDALFKSDSPEAVDEAAMHYIRAAQLLGPRPQRAPQVGKPAAQSYKDLRADLDAFGNALRDLESDLAFDLAPMPASDPNHADNTVNVRSIGRTLYFCIPPNEKLLAYWDTVADRLFKIRNSLNLQGTFRRLPLFEPPIDPALIARGVAAGLDVGQAAAGATADAPPVRFAWWLRQARELCQEARGLAGAMLQSIEKEDAEALSILRARHETALLDAMEMVRYAQWQEARKHREGLEQSIASAAHRYAHYEQMLGRKPDEITLPELEELHREGLEELKFKNSEPDSRLRAVEYDRAEGVAGLVGARVVNRHEVSEMILARSSATSMATAGRLDAVSALFGAMPNFSFNAMFWGIGPSVQISAQQIAAAIQAMSASMRADASTQSAESSEAARLNSFMRREQEWAHQSNAAQYEITTLYKQLRAAQIREAVTERELHNHRKQMGYAREIETFLSDERGSRGATQGLHAWMKRETRGLLGKAMEMATEVARNAQAAMSFEFGAAQSYIQQSYAPGPHGLLAPERLALDLKRMEIDYEAERERELELQEDVSLLQLDAAQLFMLRMTGSCTIDIPQAFFERRTPGQHHFRRLRSVALTIPCVTGPHLRLHCELQLTKSVLQTKQELKERGSGPVIVTSGAMRDDGRFDSALPDERLRPFEGYGAISTWKLNLPEARDFDYFTIPDVILHLEFTARTGPGFGAGAAAPLPGRTRLFSLEQEFPDAADRLRRLQGADGFGPLEIQFAPEHYPYWVQRFISSDGKLPLEALDFHISASRGTPTLRFTKGGSVEERPFAQVQPGMFSLPIDTGDLPSLLEGALGQLKCEVSGEGLGEIWIAVTWNP